MSDRPRTFPGLITILLGAAVATTGDHLHVAYGVLFYKYPVLLGQAYWVFPLFACATAAMLSGGEAVRKALSGDPLPADLGEALLATGAFFVAYAFTAVAAELPTFVLVVLVGTWVVRVRGLPRWVVVLSLLAAAGGVASEALLSATGTFSYVNPDFLGVPRWLPGLYLHAALATPRIRAILGGARVPSA